MGGFRTRTDKRVVKTERAIKEAVARLMDEKDIAEITPKDVADEALISKKTFLAHYPSVAAVVEEMEGDVAGSLTQAMGGIETLRDHIALRAALSRVAGVASDATTVCGRLMRSRAANDLLDKAKSALSEKLEQGIAAEQAHSEELNGMQAAYAVDFVAAGVVSAFKRWYSSRVSGGEALDVENDVSLDELASVVSSIASSGLSAGGATPTPKAAH